MKQTLKQIQVSIILMICVLSVSCKNEENRYGFNFEKNWEWKELKEHTDNYETLLKIDTLMETITIEDAQFLLSNISCLDNPEDIVKLYEIQAIQDSLGGSFYGLAPVFSADFDSIPIPSNFNKLISTSIYLTKFRMRSSETISKTGYPTSFTNEKPEFAEIASNSSNIALAFNLSAVKQTLNAFTKEAITISDAYQISQLNSFKQMLVHRRSLGYIPEPLPTEESLAQFILYTANQGPLNNLWKWLSPWNYFNLSDLYTNRENYYKIVEIIEDNEQAIENLISQRINPFVPKGFMYKDTLSFAVNWGIRSWATSNTLGTNIVQFKDNFDLLIQTIAHETFHRVQLELCPYDSITEKKNIKTFEDIVSYPCEDKKDEKFIVVLSYIFLEGTASYIGGLDNLKISEQNIKMGSDLLKEIYTEIYIKNNLDDVDALLNQGLKSNGLFYSLGYLITEQIALNGNAETLRNILINGTLNFFNVYGVLTKETSSVLDQDIENKIQELTNYSD